MTSPCPEGSIGKAVGIGQVQAVIPGAARRFGAAVASGVRGRLAGRARGHLPPSANWQRGCVSGWPQQPRLGRGSSKESGMSVYRVTEIIGTSSTSWEDAAAEAIRTAAGTLRDLRVAEVVKQDIHLDEDGAITYRTKLQLSFKYEREH